METFVDEKAESSSEGRRCWGDVVGDELKGGRPNVGVMCC